MTTRFYKPLRYLTPVVSLMLLSAYVVYSQLQHTRTVISSSKSLRLTPEQSWATNGVTTNRVRAMTREELKAWALTNQVQMQRASSTSGAAAQFDIMASSSKSAPVFPHPQEWTQVLKPQARQAPMPTSKAVREPKTNNITVGKP
jgi:hypothetical protein